MRTSHKSSGATRFEILFCLTFLGMLSWGIFYMIPAAGREAQKHRCIFFLKQIEVAKAVFAHASGGTNGHMILADDIYGQNRYFPEAPVCPAGGAYRIGRVGEKPICSIMGHSLLEKETP